MVMRFEMIYIGFSIFYSILTFFTEESLHIDTIILFFILIHLAKITDLIQIKNK